MRSLPPVLKLIGADGNVIGPVSVPTPEFASAAVGSGAIASSGGSASVAARSLYADEAGIEAEFDGNVQPAGFDDFDDQSTYEAPPDFDEPISYRREPDADTVVDPEYMIQDTATPAVAPMRVKSMPSVSGAARRKQKSSPIKTLLGFAMGAVIAVPAAASILLALDYFGFATAPNLGVWPMDGSFSKSAMVSQSNVSAPMTMPRSAEQSDSSPEGRSLAEDLDAEPSDTSDAASDAVDQILSATPELTTTQEVPGETAAPESTTSDLVAPDIATPSLDSANPDAAVMEVEPGDGTASESSSAESEAAPEAAISDPLVAEPEATNAPSATIVNSYSPELVSARADATKMLDQLTGLASDDPQRRPVLGRAYMTIAKYASQLDITNADSADEIVTTVKSNETLLNDFARATPVWIDLPPGKRPNQGVVIVGDFEADEASPVIRLFNDRAVPVELSGSETFETGRVLGLGKIVDGADGPSVSLSVVETLP